MRFLPAIACFGILFACDRPVPTGEPSGPVASGRADSNNAVTGGEAKAVEAGKLPSPGRQPRFVGNWAANEKSCQSAAWHFTATLTQNLNRGVINRGDLQLEIEGTRDGRLQTLDWQALRQDTEAPPVDYSFRYFQQVEGDFVLPGGFRPVSVTVRLGPSDGNDVVQEFDWQDATTSDAP